jgi:hypothetical protein
MFDAFFAKFEFKLALEHGGSRAKQRVTESAVVRDLQNFCKQQVRC